MECSTRGLTQTCEAVVSLRHIVNTRVVPDYLHIQYVRTCYRCIIIHNCEAWGRLKQWTTC